MPTVEILSQGDEVITGQIADTNSAWLSDRLTAIGFTVVRHVTVGDRLDDIAQALATARSRADLCICTGGLGPTEDDLTSEAVAQVFSAPLRFDPIAMAHIESLYARYRRTMPEVNRKQAWLPLGAIRLDNDWGTAPAFAMLHDGHVTVCLPGVPREMKALFDARVLPLLEQHYQTQPAVLVTLRTTGAGESTIQERIGTFDEP
ncbi:MAG: nicotinamide-nucleotide amidase, partial [Kiritimatiellia bacterium]